MWPTTVIQESYPGRVAFNKLSIINHQKNKQKEKLPRKPYNKSFIEKVSSAKMAGYWPRSFFGSLWASTSSRSINTQKKELGQYPAILTPHLVNNPYVQTEKTRLVRYWLYLLCAWLVQERFLFPRNGFKFLMHVESITSQIEVVFKLSTRFNTQFWLK